jgi:hypothetical protein
VTKPVLVCVVVFYSGDFCAINTIESAGHVIVSKIVLHTTLTLFDIYFRVGAVHRKRPVLDVNPCSRSWS